MRAKLYLYGISSILLLCLGMEGMQSEAWGRRMGRRHYTPTSAPVQRTVAKPEIEEVSLSEADLENPIELAEPAEELLPQDAHALILEKYEGKNLRPEVLHCLVELATMAQEEKPANPSSALQKIPREMRLNRDEILALNAEQAPFIAPQEYAAIEGLNRYRARCGLFPCLLDWRLCQAARGHSNNMARYRFFSHVTPWGQTHSARGARAENIYMGSRSGLAANNAWINSPGHRANMVGGYSRVGVGASGGYFTQMFR
ncbi:MAG: CAP domain-containing protein [Planctomycetia bacterium]|nr:CAP domain-containing protein [Planctomycetia bacterium]